jgi:hypothetical protein
MWYRLAWRKALVSSRYHSPSATDGPKRPNSGISDDVMVPRPPAPVAISAKNAATLSAIRIRVAGALAASDASPTPRVTRVRCRAHSGQRMPTGVGVMQSGQIGRPQLEQETPVSRFGCR